MNFGKSEWSWRQIGNGKNAKVVIRGGGRIVAIPYIRYRRGPLKASRMPLKWSVPVGYKAWG